MIIQIFKTLGAFILLMLIGTNFLGMIVRTFVSLLTIQKTGNMAVDKITRTGQTSGVIFLIFSLLITAGYFYALNHYFNCILVVAAIMLMISRLPDLILEMKTGQKLSRKNMPNRRIDIIFNIICWLALPVIWYSFQYYGT